MDWGHRELGLKSEPSEDKGLSILPTLRCREELKDKHEVFGTTLDFSDRDALALLSIEKPKLVTNKAR